MSDKQPRSIVTIEVAANGYILTLPERDPDPTQKVVDAFTPIMENYLSKMAEHEGDPELDRIRRQNEAAGPADTDEETLLNQPHKVLWDLEPAGHIWTFPTSSELLDFLDNHVFTDKMTTPYGTEISKQP